MDKGIYVRCNTLEERLYILGQYIKIDSKYNLASDPISENKEGYYFVAIPGEGDLVNIDFDEAVTVLEYILENGLEEVC